MSQRKPSSAAQAQRRLPQGQKSEYRPQGRAQPDEDRQYTDADLEFIRAMDRWKTEHHNPFPTWRDVLEVLKLLGYRKVEEPS